MVNNEYLELFKFFIFLIIIMNNLNMTIERLTKSDKSDKSDGFYGGNLTISPHTQNNGVSDKGASDKSTGTGFGDIRNAGYLRAIYLLHILVVVPLFIACCFGKRFKILGNSLFNLLGWTLLVFMGYSLLKSEITGNWNWSYSDIFNFKMKQDKKNSVRLRIVYLLHMIVVAPLLLYTNSSKKVVPRLDGAICILGILALLYHGYSYWRSETTGQWNWQWGALQTPQQNE